MNVHNGAPYCKRDDRTLTLLKYIGMWICTPSSGVHEMGMARSRVIDGQIKSHGRTDPDELSSAESSRVIPANQTSFFLFVPVWNVE